LQRLKRWKRTFKKNRIILEAFLAVKLPFS